MSTIYSHYVQKTLCGSTYLSFLLPRAGNGRGSVTSNNNARNNQNNSGTVNLSPMGGSNSNYQINSVSNSQYQFGPESHVPHLNLVLVYLVVLILHLTLIIATEQTIMAQLCSLQHL